jgi:RNA polymerase sigma factor (sigma-70 family)
MTDAELLCEYCQLRSEPAFAEIVQRHAGWIYAAALRQVRDSHLAEDVTQAVFIALAKKAPRLRKGAALSGWLFQAMRYSAGHAVRSESRRKRHERSAAAMLSELTVTPVEIQWEPLAPHLDELVGRLNKRDQQAILLRFYQQKMFAEVGLAMGLSEEAARKCTDRAVQRLRDMFARRGFSVGTSVNFALAMTQHLSHPPVGLLVSTATKAALAATAGNGLTLANAAMRMMAWAWMKTAVMVTVIGLAVAGSAIVVAQADSPVSQARPAILSTSPATNPVVAAEPPNRPVNPSNQMQVVWWDILLNENGFESIDATDSHTVQTKSEIYQGAIYDADALRAAVNAASAVGGVEGGSESMGRTQTANYGLYFSSAPRFNYILNDKSHVGLRGNVEGPEHYDNAHDNSIHVVLDHGRIAARLIELINNKETVQTSLDVKASILYDDQLQAGQALAFSTTIKDKAGASYRHIIVWEAFNFDQRDQQDFASVLDSVRWWQLGPKRIKEAADVALVWASRATSSNSTIAPQWEKKLEDGKTIRLQGLTRTDKWLFCWWNADGQPIALDNMVPLTRFNDQSLWFAAEISGPVDEWKKAVPAGKSTRDLAEQTGPFQISTCAQVSADQAIVGVPVGPWEKLGEIKQGDSMKIGADTYTLRTVQSIGDVAIYVQFSPQRGTTANTDQVTLTAVTQDGTEVASDNLQMITSLNSGIPTPQFRGITKKTLKTFNVWRRKQEWVIFSGFVTEPTPAPSDSVTAAEVAAALAKQQRSGP